MEDSRVNELTDGAINILEYDRCPYCYGDDLTKRPVVCINSPEFVEVVEIGKIRIYGKQVKDRDCSDPKAVQICNEFRSFETRNLR
jgi:hypothetical protein